VPFLARIHQLAEQCVVIAHAHIGHCPDIPSIPRSTTTLAAQVQGVVEIFDSLRSEYRQASKFILIGHSFGSWVVLQVLKTRFAHVYGAFLLFPTIVNIAQTANGRRLSWMFHQPIPTLLSHLSPLSLFAPKRLLSNFCPGWPSNQLDVLRSFLGSRETVLTSLNMAREEMLTIRGLDETFLDTARHKLWMYFAETDDWVDANRETILSHIDAASVGVVHGPHGVPHAYCINHSDTLAEQCLNWLHGIFDDENPALTPDSTDHR